MVCRLMTCESREQRFGKSPFRYSAMGENGHRVGDHMVNMGHRNLGRFGTH